jgi:hypothetical protein
MASSGQGRYSRVEAQPTLLSYRARDIHLSMWMELGTLEELSKAGRQS